MRKRYCFLLVAALLTGIFTGCAPKNDLPENTIPTLPSFPQEQTPLQQLEAAIQKTTDAETFTITYGTTTTAGDKVEEITRSQVVSAAQPLDRDDLYEVAQLLPSNENFLQEFCSLRIRAVPSNTSVIRYQVTDLTHADANQLLFCRAMYRDADSTTWSIAMDLDGQGRFSYLEVTAVSESETISAFICITFPESP